MKTYLDNSATSWPKPPSVVDSISDFLNNCGASPGRSGHAMALQSSRIVFETRELLSTLFNSNCSEKVIFTANATLASNIALKSILKKGDHVITSSMEHNSTIRPLRFLEQSRNIEISIIDCDKYGKFDLEKFKKSFKNNTKLVSIIHSSNIIGASLPIAEIGAICKKNNVLFMTDVAQSAGFLDIDMQKQNIDIVTFTGHKKLFGPPGIGGLCLNENVDIDSFIHGGSGSKSEEEYHPNFYPDKLEAGTPNTVGIVGLKAGLNFIMSEGIENIRNHCIENTKYFINKLLSIDEINIHGPIEKIESPVISVSSKLLSPDHLSNILDKEFGIMTRPGIHCCPLGHKTIKTFPQGTTRFSLGFFNTKKDIDYTIESLKIIFNKINK